MGGDKIVQACRYTGKGVGVEDQDANSKESVNAELTDHNEDYNTAKKKGPVIEEGDVEDEEDDKFKKKESGRELMQKDSRKAKEV